MEAEPEPEPVVNDDPVEVPNQNPESYCRFCFSENEVEPLFPANGAQPNAEVITRFYECIGIRLTKEDYCPSGICWMCSLTMEEFQCFRNRCLKFDAVVRSLRPVVKPEYDTEIEQKPIITKQSVTNAARSAKKSAKVPVSPSPLLPFKCPLCPRNFKHKMYLDQHSWIHRDRTGEQKPVAKKALHKTTNGAVPIGGAQTDKKNESNGPSAVNAKDKDCPISCEYCPRRFTRKMYYMQHLRRHKPDDRMYRCRHCPRSFGSQMRRTGHERKIHGPQNNAAKSVEKDGFSCPKCSRVFKHRSSLRMHLLNHDGRLPYGCEICQCRFYSVSYLALHKKRYHGPDAERVVANGTSIPCLYCSRWFLRECDRSSHIKQMHADLHANNESSTVEFNELLEESPPADSEGLTDPGTLPPNVHEPLMVIKEEEPESGDPASTAALPNAESAAAEFAFYCYSCAMPFDTEDMYAEHLDDQHPFGGEQLMDQLQSSSPVEADVKLFHCPFCPKTFTRKWTKTQHVASHMKKKGFQCEYCPAIFTRNEYLRSHRKRKHPSEPETGTHKCRYCPRLFHKARYKKVHERIAHIKKGDVLPDGDDTESETAAIGGVADKHDESSSSMAPGELSRASDSVDQTSNDAFSVTSWPEYDVEATSRLVIVLEPLPKDVLEHYRWQLDEYNRRPVGVDEAIGIPPEEDPSSVDDVVAVDEDDSNDGAKHMLKKKRSKFGITLHPCGHCPKMFKSRTALRMHTLYHSGQLPYRCDECGVQFMRYNQMEYHKTRYHGANSAAMAARYSCDYCPRIFLRKQDRTTHQMMVHARDQAESVNASPEPEATKKANRKDYVCRMCDEQFDQYRSCQRHIRVSHTTIDGGPADSKPIKLCHCSICTGIFKKNEDWHEHLKTHPSVRPHHCEQCIRRRRKKSSRKPVHRCSYCPKAFEHKPNLASHLRIHKQQLRFPCNECGVMYDRYRDLTAHQARYHSLNPADMASREPLQKCNFCPRVFTRLRDVKYHQEQVHADQAIPEMLDEDGPDDDDNLPLFEYGPELFPHITMQTHEPDRPIKPEPDLSSP